MNLLQQVFLAAYMGHLGVNAGQDRHLLSYPYTRREARDYADWVLLDVTLINRLRELGDPEPPL